MSVIRWTAPSSGWYQVSSLFTGIDPRIPYATVYVLSNGIAISEGLIDGKGAISLFSSNLLVNVGDRLDFSIGNIGLVGDQQFTEPDIYIDNLAYEPIPTIVVQPLSAEVADGTDVTLSVNALGAQPLMYQWLFNGSIEPHSIR
jgi:hypothetical protein